jgi:GDP-D-mannose dehydratase
MKKIVIINGVMGVIGSPIFSFFVEQGENIIYGISRKGLYFDVCK